MGYFIIIVQFYAHRGIPAGYFLILDNSSYPFLTVNSLTVQNASMNSMFFSLLCQNAAFLQYIKNMLAFWYIYGYTIVVCLK